MPKEFRNIDKFCECCGKQLKLNNSRDIQRKRFCSRECNGSSQLKRLWKDEKFATKIISLSSKPNPRKASKNFKIPVVKCNNCGKEIRKRIGKSGLVYCNRGCYDMYRKNNIVPREDNRKKMLLKCVICDKEYEKHPSTSKNSKYCSVQCHNIGNYLNMPKKDTKIEKIIDDNLKKLKIEYKKQKQISNKTVSDFFIEPNILIYADGDYWHNLIKNKEKDIIINDYLKNNGYKVLRYTENDIINNIEFVMNDIKNNIKIKCQQPVSNKED